MLKCLYRVHISWPMKPYVLSYIGYLAIYNLQYYKYIRIRETIDYNFLKKIFVYLGMLELNIDLELTSRFM